MNRFLKGPRGKYDDDDETLSFRCRRSEDGRVRVDGKKKKKIKTPIHLNAATILVRNDWGRFLQMTFTFKNSRGKKYKMAITAAETIT